MDNKRKTLEENYRPIVWNYFKLHANQRITLFRFYIIFISLFALVVAHLISEFHFASIYHEIVVIALCAIFIFVTIIFRCLDGRNRYLIHNAEDYFVDYEKIFEKNKNRFTRYNTAMIFTREKNDSKDSKCKYKHTSLFRWIYTIAIILSSLCILFSVSSMWYHEDNIYYQIKILNLEKKIPKIH